MIQSHVGYIHARAEDLQTAPSKHPKGQKKGSLADLRASTAGLMEATSNAGVCASITPIARRKLRARLLTSLKYIPDFNRSQTLRPLYAVCHSTWAIFTGFGNLRTKSGMHTRISNGVL